MQVDFKEYVQLLEHLIATPSISGQEDKTAIIIHDFLAGKSIPVKQLKNNIIARNKHFDPAKPTILLNSHHDTVKPNSSWKKDPFTPVVVDGKMFGLGSNDAGGPLASLIAAFVHNYDRENLSYNLIIAATAEEETSGAHGIISVLPELPEIEFAIVGEPTCLDMAVAEKGLMVLDCIAHGKSGHAARNEGDNAIYKAMEAIRWFKEYKFEKVSAMLGEIKMTVTMIEAGTQHNVVPDACRFVVDIRSTDVLSNDEVLAIIKNAVQCEVIPRSLRLQPSGLPEGHVLYQCAKDLKIKTYGSPTLSDQALMAFPSVKIGPGDSARSHTADEYLELKELEAGIESYIKMLDYLNNPAVND